MRTTTGLITAILFGVIALPAFAQTPATPNLDKREANQQRRIDQGVNSGQLTPREAGRLEKREGKLAADEAKAKSDGTVTAQERARLQREANRDSRAIHRQKNDRQTTKK